MNEIKLNDRKQINNAHVAHSINIIDARKKNAVNKVTPAAGGHQRIIIITLS